MQQPTCINLRIRSIDDALKIFMGVRQGLLCMVSRRLNADERLSLCSGCVYVWEERKDPNVSGMERFTEGRKWTQSRTQDEFLYYHEKYSPPPGLKDFSGNSPGPCDWVPLIKQTYSVVVETEKGHRKWHLTAYYTQDFVHWLGTIDDIPRIRELLVPEGIFKRPRSDKNYPRKNRFDKRLDVQQPPVMYDSEIVCPLPHVYPSEWPFPPNLHHCPSTAMSLSNPIFSTTSSHSNGYYPYSESWPSLPSTIAESIAHQSNEKDLFGYASPYQAPAPAMNSFIPLYSTSYPITSGYAPIPPPIIHLSSILERSNNVQSPVGPTSYVRPTSNVFHIPIHHHPLDVPADDTSIADILVDG